MLPVQHSRPLGAPNSPWIRIPAHILPFGPSPGLQVRPYSNAGNGNKPNWRFTIPKDKPTHESKQTHESRKPTPVASLPTHSDADLPHLTPSQTVHMTQIDEKPITKRLATASCYVYFSNYSPWNILKDGGVTKKGDVFSVARIAGITAAKKTPDIVPLCHPSIGITGVEVDVALISPTPPHMGIGRSYQHGSIHVTATVTCLGRTGVEMEAMTAVMGAALTVYDMLKAVDKGMSIGRAEVLEKMGGKSGHWVRGRRVSDKKDKEKDKGFRKYDEELADQEEDF